MKFGSAQSHYSVLGSYHSSSSFQRCLSVRGLRERPLSTKGTIIRGRFVGLSAQAGSPMPNDLGADLLGPSDEPSLAQVGLYLTIMYMMRSTRKTMHVLVSIADIPHWK